MALSFESVVSYGDNKMKITSDNIVELHQALAGVSELDRDVQYLRAQGVEEIIPAHRADKDGHEYFGFSSRTDTRNITFGQKREKGIVPWFPKGENGYFDPKG